MKKLSIVLGLALAFVVGLAFGVNAYTLYTDGSFTGIVKANTTGQATQASAADIFTSVGTTFTISSGCATVSALTGGPTAGSFATTTTGTCTPVIVLPTAPNGRVCH